MAEIKLNLKGNSSFLLQEAYKVLRTNLQFCGRDIRVVAITSCNENEGKSTVTLNLAKSLAELGKDVLVVDADMRKSVMAERNTNIKNSAGLSEVISGIVDFDDAVLETQYPHLHVMLAGKYPPNPVELLDGKYFSDMIKSARNRYDYILIDTPPLGAVIDAAVIATNCDGTVLVINQNSVRYRQAQEVVAQLEKSNCKILGVVRNCINVNSKGYYYKKKKYYRYG